MAHEILFNAQLIIAHHQKTIILHYIEYTIEKMHAQQKHNLKLISDLRSSRW